MRLISPAPASLGLAQRSLLIFWGTELLGRPRVDHEGRFYTRPPPPSAS